MIYTKQNKEMQSNQLSLRQRGEHKTKQNPQNTTKRHETVSNTENPAASSHKYSWNWITHENKCHNHEVEAFPRHRKKRWGTDNEKRELQLQ